MSELCKKSAVQVVRLLKSGEVSPEDLLDAAFSRIDTVDAQINASVSYTHLTLPTILLV